MARIKPDTDSEDEFPDVAQLVQRSKTKKDGASSRDSGVPSNTSATGRSSGNEMKEVKEDVKGLKKKENVVAPKPKKRVLNQKSDNPLLRPLSIARDEGRKSRTVTPDGGVGSGVGARAKETRVRGSREVLSRDEVSGDERTVVKAKGLRAAVSRGSEECEDEIMSEKTVTKRGKETRILLPGYPRLVEKKLVAGNGKEVAVGQGDVSRFFAEAGASRPGVKARSSDQRSERDVVLPSAKETKRSVSVVKQKAIVILDSDTEHDNPDDIAGLINQQLMSDRARVSDSGDNILAKAQPKQSLPKLKRQPTTTQHSDTEQDHSSSHSNSTSDNSTSSKARSSDQRTKPNTSLPKLKEPNLPVLKSKQKATPTPPSDTEQDDSDNLSDFIVNDSTFLDDGESVLEIPPPRSVRRLVQGRRPRTISSDSDAEDLDLRLGKLNLEENDPFAGKKGDVDALKGLRDLVDGFASDGEDEDIPAFRLPKQKIPQKTQREIPKPGKQTQAPAPPAAQTQNPTSRPTTSSSEFSNHNPFTLKLYVSPYSSFPPLLALHLPCLKTK